MTKTDRFAGLRRAFAPLVVLWFAAAAAPAAGPVAAGDQRRPAPVMGASGADWLEREGREEEQRPAEIFRAMGLKDGDVVADLGCGTGWFARRMARGGWRRAARSTRRTSSPRCSSCSSSTSPPRG